MRKIIILSFILVSTFVNAQAYKGKGDVKFQVGANIQKWGSGISVSNDFGVGENMSFGFVGSYLLNTNEEYGMPKFSDRFDIKARFNANISNVLKLNDKIDLYPGLDLGLRNFGAHLGGRYFFSDGFGLYSEVGFPLAKYDTNPTGYYYDLNNQFVLTIGTSFNL
ncbi:DUF6646 family protein [Flavobacterium sp.]|uniref:DUF6646 family protein n=1 Tax=Flavobacterium sp. TaxID=239 RepID=UPI003BC57D36